MRAIKLGVISTMGQKYYLDYGSLAFFLLSTPHPVSNIHIPRKNFTFSDSISFWGMSHDEYN